MNMISIGGNGIAGGGGGPASSIGISLRDYFAAKAMQGLLYRPEYFSGLPEMVGDAYRVADAMLEARGAQ